MQKGGWGDRGKKSTNKDGEGVVVERDARGAVGADVDVGLLADLAPRRVVGRLALGALALGEAEGLVAARDHEEDPREARVEDERAVRRDVALVRLELGHELLGVVHVRRQQRAALEHCVHQRWVVHRGSFTAREQTFLDEADGDDVLPEKVRLLWQERLVPVVVEPPRPLHVVQHAVHDLPLRRVLRDVQNKAAVCWER